MINFKNAKTIGSLLIGALLLVACENSDSESEDNLEIINTESADFDADFKSTTGNSGNDVDLDFTSDIKSEVVFKMNFDSSISEEEAQLEFNKAKEDYFNSLEESTSASSKSIGTEAFSTEWFTQVYMTSGSQSGDGTTGKVSTVLFYTTSAGEYRYTHVLNEAGNELESGGFSYSLLRQEITEEPIEWVELDEAWIVHRGTDGWYFIYFYNNLDY